MSATAEELQVEGLKVCKLICVAVNNGNTKQSNKFYNMYEQDDGKTFIAEYGRVEGSSATKTYPISKWDSTIRSKTKKGYKDVTHLFAEVVEEDGGTSSMVDIQDKVVKKLMDELQRFANSSIEANYTVSSKNVTQAQVDEAQTALDAITKIAKVGKSVDDLNEQLLHLFHIIPRKMKDVRDHIFEGTKITKTMLTDINQRLADEQDTLDVMAGQVLINDEKDEVEEEHQHIDLLTMLGIEVTEGTQEDYDYVAKKMASNAGQVKKVYRVVHKATQKAFDAHLANASDKHVRHFFHGSRNQNWLNILSTGLMIRPAGAIHNGSMFGDGIYFADKAQKSIGYTSLRGSYWTGGGDNKGYLAMFAVHTGKWKRIKHHNSSCYNLSKRVLANEGYDSVFAEGGADLRNNEYIVYDGAQCTISHLIEIG